MQDVIEQFVKATEHEPSPETFRRWAGVSLVSTAATRKVWSKIVPRKKLFANTFIWLVAEAGGGKSSVIDHMTGLLRQLRSHDDKPSIGLSPDAVTHEKLLAMLADTFRSSWEEGYRSFGCLISEAGSLFKKPDTAFLQNLARIWDSADHFDYETKNSGGAELFYPYLNMLVGAQPEWLAHGLPHEAYTEGFAPRTLFIYSADRVDLPFAPGADDEDDAADLLAPLVPQLQAIHMRRGYMPLAPEAFERLNEWRTAGYAPVPTDPLLARYRDRRRQHVGKLALVVALARAHERVELADLDRAFELLFAAEADMPKALAHAGGNTFSVAEDNVVAFVRQYVAMNGGSPAPEYLVYQRIGKLADPQFHKTIIDNLVAQQRIVTKDPAVRAPNRRFFPGSEQ